MKQAAATPVCQRGAARPPQKSRAARKLYESQRVDPIQGFPGASPALSHALGMAAIAEVQVYRLAEDQWHLIGCHQRLDVSTAQLEPMGYAEFVVLHKELKPWQPVATYH